MKNEQDLKEIRTFRYQKVIAYSYVTGGRKRRLAEYKNHRDY